MQFTAFLFYFLATVLVFAALRVVTARSPVHAALYLVLAFFTASGIWLLLKAEFLAIALVLVYVGAVMVLFLFVVMMLDLNVEQLRQGFWQNIVPASIVGGLMLIEMVMVVGGNYFRFLEPAGAAVADRVSNTKQLGYVLYTDYLLPFELAAVLLLVAIIAAIALTFRGRKNSKAIDPAEQIAVRRNDRVRIVSMPAEKD